MNLNLHFATILAVMRIVFLVFFLKFLVFAEMAVIFSTILGIFLRISITESPDIHALKGRRLQK